MGCSFVLCEVKSGRQVSSSCVEEHMGFRETPNIVHEGK